MLSPLFLPLAAFALVGHVRGDTGHVALVTKRDLGYLAVSVAATSALGAIDRPVSREFFEPRWLRDTRLQRTASAVAFFGGDGPFVISGVLYTGGILLQSPGLSQVGLHDDEAIALAATVTGLAKGVAGRALPGVATNESFSFGRGFHDRNGPFVSFPSGHESAAFALSTTLGAELERYRPNVAAHARPWLISGAVAVGVARVVQRMHWPSDLPLGAAIGVWSGSTVEHFAALPRRGGSVGSAGTAVDVGRAGTAADVVGAVVRGMSIAPTPAHRTMIMWSLRASEAGDN